MDQHRPIVFKDDEPIDRERIIVAEKTPDVEYFEALQFAEEPISIRIERSAEKFAPNSVDCWVNGIGAEIMINGKWVQCGYLPVGHVVTTKRKYVEVLARSKQDTVQTAVLKHEDFEENTNPISTSQKVPFSVIRDANPRGAEWLTKLIREL